MVGFPGSAWGAERDGARSGFNAKIRPRRSDRCSAVRRQCHGLLPVVNARVGDKKSFDAAFASGLLNRSGFEPDFAEREGADPLKEFAG